MKSIQVWNNVEHGDSNLAHEYDIEVRENDATGDKHYALKRSFSKDWSNPGEIVATLLENNQDSMLTIKFGKQKMTLDYSEISELFTILGYMNDELVEYRETKVVKSFK
jgi:hypothetical protein